MELNEQLKITKAGHGGIDYSHGKSNVDATTGIHYGVIHNREVLQSWADFSEPSWGIPICAECPECEHRFDLEGRESQEDMAAPCWEWGDMCACPQCGCEFELEIEDGFDPIGYDLNDGEYVAWEDEQGDIMIICSPYYTYAQYCSPCAPGAGDLSAPFKMPEAYKETSRALQQISPLTDGDMYQDLAHANGFPRVFCFHHSWFENGKAPYRVFDVQTGKEVMEHDT